MSERYWITGVQLGLLQSLNDLELRAKAVNGIIDKQFIGNYYTEKEQQDFKKQIKQLGRKKQ